MSILRRLIVRSGYRTTTTLEDEFWEGLQAIAKTQGKTISQLIIQINDQHDLGNLSSAIRMFVLRYYRNEWQDTKHNIN